MKSCMPDAYKELVENCKILEGHYKDMMVIPCKFYPKEKIKTKMKIYASLSYTHAGYRVYSSRK